MITPDSQAILSLCSHVGLPTEAPFAPFSLKEWNLLAKKLQAAGLRPEHLLEWTKGDLLQNLGTEIDAERIKWLIGRTGSLALELERLESHGIKVVTRADPDYPRKYRQRLRDVAPAVLFYAGEKALLGQPGIAVVGSRHVDAAGEECAQFVGNACGFSGLVLYSGGAKGVDSLSMQAALEARGTAVGILAHSLESEVRKPENRAALQRGDLCLATPYSPGAGFSVGNAMGRNRLIYTLADYAVVVASDAGKGGTWAGATEALKAEWIPVFVLEHEAMPDGNKELLIKGAAAFPHPFLEHFSNLAMWLKDKAANTRSRPSQSRMF
jgi:predicted Rossmann fold nucleotide-binding protein DprA/Smf involved in DNA uptake